MKPTADHSFPDCEITEWRLTPETLDVGVTGVFYDGQLRGPAAIHFPLSRPATAMSYDHETNKWIDETEVEPLKDLCEFHHKMGKLYSLKGFGRTSGKWLAVSVVSEHADISWQPAWKLAENSTIGVRSKNRWIAIGTLIVSVASILLFVICRNLGFDFYALGCATLGFAISALWAPALIYIGVRTRSRFDVISGFLATSTLLYWLWLLVSS